MLRSEYIYHNPTRPMLTNSRPNRVSALKNVGGWTRLTETVSMMCIFQRSVPEVFYFYTFREAVKILTGLRRNDEPSPTSCIPGRRSFHSRSLRRSRQPHSL